MYTRKLNENLLLRFAPDSEQANTTISKVVGAYNAFNDRRIVVSNRLKRDYSEAYLQSRPTVTVYIPTYNRIEYLLDRSIPSVLRQTYENIKILVSDDGSTDGTADLIRKFYGDKVNLIQCSRKEYRYPPVAFYHWLVGPVHAANQALKTIKDTHWIARIDDDDEWVSDHIQESIEFAIKNRFEFVSSCYLVKSETGSSIVGPDKINNIGGTQTWLYHGGLSQMLYNIHCWRKKNNRVNDTDLQQRMFDAGVRIGFRNKVSTVIRPRAGESLIGSKAYLSDPAKYEDFYA